MDKRFSPIPPNNLVHIKDCLDRYESAKEMLIMDNNYLNSPHYLESYYLLTEKVERSDFD